jgi:hypothetical protein
VMKPLATSQEVLEDVAESDDDVMRMSSIYVSGLLQGCLPLWTLKLALKLSLLIFGGHFLTLLRPWAI